MITDARLDFGTMNLANAAMFGGGLAALGNVIDLGDPKGAQVGAAAGANSGPRRPMTLRLVARSAAVGAGGGGSGVVTPQLITGPGPLDGIPGSGLYGVGVPVWTGFGYLATQFVNGRLLGEFTLPPKMELGRYVQLIWVPSASGFTSGLVEAYWVADSSNPDVYPNAVP